MNIQTIVTPSGDQMVLLSKDDYEVLMEAARDCADLASIEAFRAKLQSGEEELVPAAIADRLIAGENAIRVWREYRGLSVKALAEAAGIAPAYLSQMETGKRDGTVQTMLRLSKALNLKIDDLIAS